MMSGASGVSGGADSVVKELTRGVTLQRIAGGQIIILTISRTVPEAVDAWAEASLRMLDVWPPDRPYLLLHDVSTPGVALTPYIRQRSRELATAAPHVGGRVAVLLPRGALGRVIRIYLNYLSRNANRTLRAFLDRDEALAWLREALPPEPPPTYS